jgi:hypothetical protein
MLTAFISITMTVLCTDSPNTFTRYSETTIERFEHDVQLLRQGWFDGDNERRCKAVKIKYVTHNKGK